MSTAPTESPRFLGRYELVHPLGQGGMGEVFLAKISGAAGFEKPCIVKTILPALLKDRQFLDRFHHEAKVLVHLVHSSIAQVYDMGETDGTYYMALEYVAGVDLAYLLEQARAQGVAVPAPVALFIGQRMAEGLAYAHRKAGPDGTPLGIVHRDVSPHNVMVSYEGEVKVIDFGLAKSAARSKYTLPSTVMGKLGYMSPEQVRAEALDHRSDIYSCGVVVWEMLAGRSLIPHGTVGEMMAAMSQPVVPSLTGLRPDVDAALDAVVRRALEAKPDGRYARTDEMARALNGELVRSGAAVGAEEVGQFVRTLCPEAFSEQRKLISKVTSSSNHRRTPAPGTGTGVYGTGPRSPSEGGDGSGHEPTLVRDGSGGQPRERPSGGMARPGAVYEDGDDVDTGATTLRQAPDAEPATARGGVHGTGRISRPVAKVEVDPAIDDEVTAPRRPSRPRSVAEAQAREDALEARAARRRPMGLYAAIAVLLVIATAATTALLVRPESTVPAPVSSAVGTGPAVPTAGGGLKSDASPGGTGTAVTGAPAPGTPGTGTAAQGAAGVSATGTAVAGTGTAAQGTPGASGTGASTAAGTQVAGASGTGTSAAGTPGTGASATGTSGTGTSVAATPGTGTSATGTAAQGAQAPSTPVAGAVGTGKSAVVPAGGQVASAEGAAGGKTDAAKTPTAEGGKRPTSTAKGPVKNRPGTTTASASTPAPAIRYVTAAAVLKVVEEGGRYYVERDPNTKLASGMDLQVVGPEGKNRQRPLLGLARVQSVVRTGAKLIGKPQRAYLELDVMALASTGELYLSVPPAAGKSEANGASAEEAPPAETPVKPVKQDLYGSVTRPGGVQGLVDRGELRVRNLGTTPWTKCYVVKDHRHAAWLGDLKPGEVGSASRFRRNLNFDVPTGKVKVVCEEGELITKEP